MDVDVGILALVVLAISLGMVALPIMFILNAQMARLTLVGVVIGIVISIVVCIVLSKKG